MMLRDIYVKDRSIVFFCKMTIKDPSTKLRKLCLIALSVFEIFGGKKLFNPPPPTIHDLPYIAVAPCTTDVCRVEVSGKSYFLWVLDTVTTDVRVFRGGGGEYVCVCVCECMRDKKGVVITLWYHFYVQLIQ